MNAESPETPATPAEVAPWWTSAVPGLVVVVGIVLGGSLGVALGAAPGAIFLGGSVLVGAILLFWSSVRLLLGEQLPGVDLSDEVTERAPEDPLYERKRAALAALQDMERERELGKIGEADYDEVVLPLREQAKTVMKELDARVAPHREEAERLAAEFLKRDSAPKKKKAKVEAKPEPEPEPQAAPLDEDESEPVTKAEEPSAKAKARLAEVLKSKSAPRLVCAACDADNEPDAKFCKSCGKPMGVQDAS